MQERAKKTRNIILKTAVEEFSAKGFHGARIDEIAERAKVNKQRIYAYFHNKEELFTAVLKDCYLKVIIAEEDLGDLLEEDIPYLGEIILRQYIQFHQANPEFWRLLTWENLGEGKHVEVLSNLRSESIAHIRNLYQKGQGMGHFKKEVSFDVFLYNLTAISYFMFSNRSTMQKMFGLKLSDDVFRNNFISQILKMLDLPQRIG